jgi:hypothetical protein
MLEKGQNRSKRQKTVPMVDISGGGEFPIDENAAKSGTFQNSLEPKSGPQKRKRRTNLEFSDLIILEPEIPCSNDYEMARLRELIRTDPAFSKLMRLFGLRMARTK